LIEVRDLVKQYGDHTAVDHLSFTIETGQIYGFLGPNGAGKSTTMNIMTGYLSPTSGEVIINGHSILEEPELAKQNIGYLPELPPLYMDMTVKEYLTFAAQLKHIPKAEQEAAIAEVVELARLKEVYHRLVANLSKGYKQRVGVAQAILGFPEVIILDEPTVGLDPSQIIETRELIHKLSDGHTVIISSHILSEIQAICDHVLIIHKGQLVANGTPEELERQLADTSMELVFKSDDPNAIRALLRSFPEVERIRVNDPVNGEISAKAKLTQGADIREQMFRACAAKDVPLLMMHASTMSLEDIFLKLTQTNERRPRKRRAAASAPADADTAEQTPDAADAPAEKEAEQ